MGWFPLLFNNSGGNGVDPHPGRIARFPAGKRRIEDARFNQWRVASTAASVCFSAVTKDSLDT
jgi:hypothetical protein